MPVAPLGPRFRALRAIRKSDDLADGTVGVRRPSGGIVSGDQPPSVRQADGPVGSRRPSAGLADGFSILDAVDRDRNGARARLVVLSGTSSGREALARFGRSERLAVGMQGLLRPLAVFEPDEELLRGSGFAFTEASARGALLALAYDAPGPTLAELFAASGVSGTRAAGIVSALSAALGGLHDQGIALGCLQPELVFVVEGDVLVAGFGVAELAHALGGPKLVRDTLPEAYRAPELMGELRPLPEPWSDVFALGVLATELFRTISEARTEKVEVLVRRAVSPSPAARPADVRRWAAELSAALLSTPPEAPQLPPTPPQSPPDVREPAPLPSTTAAPPEFPVHDRIDAADVSAGVAAPEPSNSALSAAPPVSQPTEAEAPPAPLVSGAAQQAPAPRSPGTLAATLALISGILLLSAGVGAVFAYVLVARAALPPLASSAAAVPPPVAPVVVPGPTALSEPDAGSHSSENPDERIEELEHGAASGAVRFSPEDVRAPLPVDAARPVWGSKDALVTLVVFGDLECAHTRRAFAALSRLKQKLGDELRIVWRHRPLTRHEHARSAALYAAALHASRGDAAFFRLVSNLSKSSAPPTAAELERSTPKPSEEKSLDAARAAKAAAERLAQDLVLAAQLRVRKTPTMFINGIRVDGYATYDELQRLVERELVGARATLASGVARRELYARRTLKNLVNVGAP